MPIELRRLEDFDDIPEPPLSAGLKSRSLGSILNPPPKIIVRSRSSVPSLGTNIVIPEIKKVVIQPANSSDSRRPKLVKQKQSLCDDVDYPVMDDTNKDPDKINQTRIQLLRKQSSLNEELMAESRLREKDRIRRRIQKQMSLNETFLCRSLFTKRLQVIREGFTTKLKTSTGSLERVTKNGFVRMMQNIKGPNQQHPHHIHQEKTAPTETNSNINVPLSRTNSTTSSSIITSTCNGYDKLTFVSVNANLNTNTNNNNNNNNNIVDEGKPRRHSRESGSGKLFFNCITLLMISKLKIVH